MSVPSLVEASLSCAQGNVGHLAEPRLGLRRFARLGQERHHATTAARGREGVLGEEAIKLLVECRGRDELQ
jgi:hypothetical protein